MKRSDRIIGIVLGLVIGIAAVILFVFGGGAGSLDAPSIDQSTTVEQPATGGGEASP
jgi:uncharacterized membrane protein required for colicin V production